MSKIHLQLRIIDGTQEWKVGDYFGRRLDNSPIRRHTAIFSAFGGAVVVVLILLMVIPHLRHGDDSASTGLAEERVVAAEISKHYLLPTNEIPALATVTDSSKLDTPFLKQAKNGDKILIYQKNEIAIIYRPSIDRIIAVGPVTIDKPPTGNAPALNGGQ